ncbi:adenylyl cyclase, putative [Trichomonas vaginalis G3]|uniref:Adenylyl cyclase, putative n=1 Tax=Trichomonas vaginalis (strain ATCC PRA-98 / G3) TaxID=412133 RepID=A2DK30_TRIV3|nr:hypothetical protein TVAGG3_0169630 [Trichomonas vaginalis G3]EAY19201.1 adenylyl cyclase, putative [Trichomonas vaginalis G3]KAI5548486.1 hypothetical protein TVAGG3_0169630 [Trichomonas vaginalis G3]|eukprot:XP_001580187.1 adenylyl cyclase [Trichomonas vaginalis G3]
MSGQFNDLQPPPQQQGQQNMRQRQSPNFIFNDILKVIDPDATFQPEAIGYLGLITSSITNNYVVMCKRFNFTDFKEEYFDSVNTLVSSRLESPEDFKPEPSHTQNAPMPQNYQYNQYQMQQQQMNQMQYGMQMGQNSMQMGQNQMQYGMQMGMNQMGMPNQMVPNQYGMPMQQPMNQGNQKHINRMNAIKQFKESQEGV